MALLIVPTLIIFFTLIISLLVAFITGPRP
jgi:hypothetical protein